MVTLAVRGISVHYGRRQVLHDVTLPELSGGEFIAVVGPNAVGKSTLFRRMVGLVSGTGLVEINGRGVEGLVPQDPLYPCYLPQDTGVNAVLTVFESVLLALKQGSSWRVSDHEIERVEETLDLLGIGELGERHLSALSGGQRQLVSIAQALVRRPQVLLLDEPTSALDLQRQLEVLELLRHLARRQGLCVLVALHDLNQVMRFADTVIVMSEGRLIASGTPEGVLTPDLLRRVYGVEARVETCSQQSPFIIVDQSVRAARTGSFTQARQ